VQQVLNNIHDSVDLISLWCVSSVCSGVAKVESSSQNFSVARTDEAQTFELLQLLVGQMRLIGNPALCLVGLDVLAETNA
jgi:hypothetical protein